MFVQKCAFIKCYMELFLVRHVAIAIVVSIMLLLLLFLWL